MSHGIELSPVTPGLDPNTPLFLMPLAKAVLWVNRALVTLGMIALVVAACVLTYSVVSRYVLQASTDWQDEAAVFCLVGATFMCGAFVQSVRGHVGIEAIAGLLSPRINALRLALVDLLGSKPASFIACGHEPKRR